MDSQPRYASTSFENVSEKVTNHSTATTDQVLAQSQQASGSAAYVWYVTVLLTVVNGFNYMDRMAMSVLMPYIKTDMDLSDAQLGLLVGFAFALFYAVCGIPIARWADRGNRRNICAIALATWSVMTALTGAAQNFWHLFAARVGVGAGEAGGMPPAHSMLCDYVPLKRRPGVFAIYAFGGTVGTMLGLALAGSLAEVVGWRATFVALGLPGVFLAIILRLTLREPARGTLDVVDKSSLSFGQVVSFLLRSKTYKLLMLFFVANGFIFYALSQWWPSFYVRTFHLSVSSIGLQLGVAIGVGTGIGMLIGGVLSNKGAERSVRAPLIISAAAMCFVIPATAGALLVSSATVSINLVFVAAVFWAIPNGPVLATLYSVALPSMRATAGAITIFFSSVIGFGLGPFFVGVLSDFFASLGPDGLRRAMLAPIGLMPIIVIALYLASATLSFDLKRIKEQSHEAAVPDFK